MATVDVSTSIVIERPRNQVAAYAANPDNAPAWYERIESVEWKTHLAFGLGAQVAFVARFLGRRLTYTYEVIDLVPGSRLVMRTSEGPFPMETTYTWESTAQGGTHMTLRNRGIPTGFSRVVAPFLTFAMRRANAQDLSRLKRLLERHEDTAPVRT